MPQTVVHNPRAPGNIAQRKAVEEGRAGEGEQHQPVARHPGASAVQTRQLQLLSTSLALNLLLASVVEGVLEAFGPFPFPHTSLEGA